MRYSAAIFDLDGTLIDSLADIGASMNKALATHALPTHPIERYRQFVGEGVEVLAKKASGDHALQADVLATYRGLYADNLFGHTLPYAGIPELLTALRDMPMLLVVISWLGILFFSFGLFAPANPTAIGALMVASISVAGAIFLILELDQPFSGFIKISSEPMRNALVHVVE